MIKANGAVKKAGVALEAGDIETVAGYLRRNGDGSRMKVQADIETLTSAIHEAEERIEARREEIVERERIIERDQERRTVLERKLEEMPEAQPIGNDVAQADIARALALPYIKSIAIEEMDRKQYIVATTRANSLFTILDRKYSRSERWYRAKPYKIALPAYKIRIGTAPNSTLAQNREALGLALADSNDTAHWLEWIKRYGHEPHPHWGTQSVSSSNRGEYKAVCLGEFESEVTQTFKRSIADGLMLFAIYLQTAGSVRAYITKKETWALWLGKRGYNVALVPSEKEVKTLEADSGDEEETDGERYDENGDRDGEGDYDSNGNLL